MSVRTDLNKLRHAVAEQRTARDVRPRAFLTAAERAAAYHALCERVARGEGTTSTEPGALTDAERHRALENLYRRARAIEEGQQATGPASAMQPTDDDVPLLLPPGGLNGAEPCH
jgi:hypothetical protein